MPTSLNSAACLAVVCPMANEAATAERFAADVLAQCRAGGARDVRLFAILDRASTDDTLARLRALAAREPGLQVVWAPGNRGVVDAYFRGYREALATPAGWILEMDAGYSHLPQEIPRFLAAGRDGIDCVFATRFGRGGVYQGGWSRRWWVSRAGGLLARGLLGLPLDDPTSGFQLYSRRALERVVQRGVRARGPFFQTEIKYLLRDLPHAEVPITYTPTGQLARIPALLDAARGLLRLFLQRWAPATARPPTGGG